MTTPALTEEDFNAWLQHQCLTHRSHPSAQNNRTRHHAHPVA